MTRKRVWELFISRAVKKINIKIELNLSSLKAKPILKY